jgi:DNA polymerase-1
MKAGSDVQATRQTTDVLLIDATGYLFRAYYALPKLTNHAGEPTGAIVGTLNILHKLVTTWTPRYLGVVFDAGGGTFRHTLDEQYKANRPQIQDELRQQIQPLQEIVDALGWPRLIIPQVEADDTIGTLARQANALGLQTVIATNDKDLAQLVTDHVCLFDSTTERLLDATGVKAKFGVAPSQIADYLCLLGDASDNIPGVPQCGPKTAASWLQHYGTLENLLAHADELKGRAGRALQAHREQVQRTRQLTTIRCDVPLPYQLTELCVKEANTEVLRHHYQRIGSQRLLATVTTQAESVELETSSDAPTSDVDDDQLITCEAEVTAWLASLVSIQPRELALVAFMTPTRQAIGLALAVQSRAAIYIPLAHDQTHEPISSAWLMQALQPILSDPTWTKISPTLKDCYALWQSHKITVQGAIHDPILASYVLQSTIESQRMASHDLHRLAHNYLQRSLLRLQDLPRTGKATPSLEQMPARNVLPYVTAQAEVSLALHEILWKQLQDQPRLAELYQTLELPLVPVLAQMEQSGIRLDTERLAQQSRDCAARLKTLEHQAHHLAGRVFNLASPKQIGHILFHELGLQPAGKTATGALSTAEATLEQLANAGHELPAVILEHRALAKLRSTYIDKLPRLVHQHSQRLHTHYHQSVTSTGRLSSSDPNLQNIPIRRPEGRLIRQAFVAEPGWQLVAADYSQIELRLMAHVSADAGLIQAFSSGQDIHQATAAELHGISLDAVTATQRRQAKIINFGLLYGMSAFGLAQQLGIERSAAQQYMETYFARYPGIVTFMEHTRQQAQAQGWVETIFGRRLYIADITHRHNQKRAAAERAAINAPLQGSAADIIKRAMVQVADWLRVEQPPVRLLMQVHDELVFEVLTPYVREAFAPIQHCMETAANLAVPLVVNIGYGEHWDAAH